MQGSSATWNYTYDAGGLRTSRSNGTTTYRHWYNDSGLLLRMEKGNTVYSFTYDPAGHPVSFTEGNDTYYYVLNQQGDVIGIVDDEGIYIVSYVYDAWGLPIKTQGTERLGIGERNPLRYRGYVYDTETELYYLQSRYYNPEMGRFINADDPGYMGVDGTPSSYNLFSYCGNNPVTRADEEGKFFHIIIGAAVGAFVGLAGQFISDLSTSLLTGEWSFSNWQTYVGATIGGAFGGAAFGATGCVGLADAVSGFVSTGVGMSLEKLTGAKDYSWEEISLNAVADGAVSYGLGKLPGINKVTKGRNSWFAVYKSGLTKLRNKTVSHMSKKVIAKGVGSGLVGGLPMNGYGLVKQFAYDPVKEYILGLMR